MMTESKQGGELPDEIWYSKNDAMSRNPMLLYAIGGRGVGKTFEYKKWCLLDEDDMFMWVRRYDTEMKKCKKTFLKDMISEGVIEPSEWSIKGSSILHNGKERGYFVTLSKSLIEKSGSFADVNKIIFDEALLAKGAHRYLKDEVETLLELIETVNRMRGAKGLPEVRTVCIGNKTSFMNPHFEYWGILPFAERFRWAPGKKGLVLVENYNNEEFKELKRATRMGRLVDGTRYGDYSIDNQAWYDDDAFIEAKPSNAVCQYILRYKGHDIGVWTTTEMVFMSRRCPVGTWIIACSRDDVSSETRDTMYPTLARTLVSVFQRGDMRFEDAVVKGVSFEVMQKWGSMK